MSLSISSEGLVSNLAIGEAFRQLCSLQGAQRFTYQGADLKTSEAADHNQMLPIFAAFATLAADQSNLGAEDVPLIFEQDAESLTGVSCKFKFNESSYPPSLILTLLDYAVEKSMEASVSPNVGNLDYLSAQIQSSFDMEDDLDASA